VFLCGLLRFILEPDAVLLFVLAATNSHQGIMDVSEEGGKPKVEVVVGVNRLSRHDFMSEPCRGKHSYKQKYCVCKNWVPSKTDEKELSFKERFNKTADS
jgi:hypothetical protein